MNHQSIPVKIRRDEQAGHYSVHLGDLDVTKYLLAEGGVQVEFVNIPGLTPGQPAITLRFCPGFADLDLDAALIEYVRRLDQDEVA